MKRAFTLFTMLLACMSILWANRIVVDSTTYAIDYPYATKIILDDATGLYGVTDCNDNILIPFRFDSIGYADNDYADTTFVVVSASQHTLYGISGSRIAPEWYDDLTLTTIETGTDDTPTAYVVAQVRKGEFTGFLDFNGDILIPVEFDATALMSITEDGRLIALVAKDNKLGILDEKGKWILPLQDNETGLHPIIDIGDCYLFANSQDECWAFKPTTGQTLARTHRYLVGPTENGVFGASDDGENYKFITWDDVEISPQTFPLLYPAGNTMMLVGNKKGKFALYNDRAQPITGFIFKDSACDPADYLYHDGPFYHFTIDNRRCIVLSDFSDGLAAVGAIDSKKYAIDDIDAFLIGFIDTNGKWVIKPQYPNAYAFEDGFAIVQINQEGEWVKIDTKGRVVEKIGLLDFDEHDHHDEEDD